MKALDQHKRIAHKCISPVVDLVPDISICPMCKVDFNVRVRLISHLSDKRIRSKRCGPNYHSEFLKSRPPSVPEVAKSKLRGEQAKASSDAGYAGHTHVLATIPANSAKRKAIDAQMSNGVGAPVRRSALI